MKVAPGKKKIFFSFLLNKTNKIKCRKYERTYCVRGNIGKVAREGKYVETGRKGEREKEGQRRKEDDEMKEKWLRSRTKMLNKIK